jgi:ABC-2 type transport system ATP-binding protein
MAVSSTRRLSIETTQLPNARRSQVRNLALVLEQVCKHYGNVTALAGIDFEMRRGEIVALLGINGAGKTTFMLIAAGLSRPDNGVVWVDGINVYREPRRASVHLGIAPQEVGLYLPLSVRDNLRFFGELAGLRRRELNARVKEVADALRLSDLLDRRARTLSVGEARRLHTAMVLLRRRPLLLLDEPTSGVDIDTRMCMLELVRDLAAEGSAICYSTHYLAEAEQLGGSVAILDGGRLVVCGSQRSLINRYGGRAIELYFEGEPPPQFVDNPNVERSNEKLRILTDSEPSRAIAETIAALGGATSQLRGVQVVEPNLETVFRSITNQHHADRLE